MTGRQSAVLNTGLGAVFCLLAVAPGCGPNKALPAAVARIVQAIATGESHSLALLPNGTVQAFGQNLAGQLGDGSNTDSNLPVPVSNLTNVRGVACGFSHSLAFRADGTVWAWGSGNSGQLGDGFSTNRNTPVQVDGPGGAGFLTSVTALAGGQRHSIARRSDGTVWTWGNNGSGQLGDGTNTVSITPVQVHGPGNVGFLTDVVAIASIRFHNLAIRSDGTLWAWGDNSGGQLGDGTQTNRNAPVQVVGPGGAGFLTNVAAIACGTGYSVAARNDGTVWAWGSPEGSMLGDGTTNNSLTPVQVHGPGNVGFLTGAIAVAGGDGQASALRNDGTVFAWGWGSEGRLGNGANSNSTTPVQVVGPGGSGFLTGIGAISCWDFHELAIRNDGTVFSWGRNDSGQLGNGTNNDSNFPVPVTGLPI